ncbi:MAG: SMC-Scp complex subunit ScpB [Candidatus Bilamarchaeum sp.]
MKEEKKLIEAALFISARPMSLEEIRTLTGIGALGYLQNVLNELKKEYEERSIEITETEGKYEMRIKNDYLGKVKQFAQDIEITKSAIRTLAYLSKHDGMLKSELVRKIGTNVYTDVKELVDSGFVKATRSGRTSKLTLTDKFKKYFVSVPSSGVSLADVSQTSLSVDIEETKSETVVEEISETMSE